VSVHSIPAEAQELPRESVSAVPDPRLRPFVVGDGPAHRVTRLRRGAVPLPGARHDDDGQRALSVAHDRRSARRVGQTPRAARRRTFAYPPRLPHPVRRAAVAARRSTPGRPVNAGEDGGIPSEYA